MTYCRCSLFVLAIGSCSPTSDIHQQKEDQDDPKEVIFTEEFGSH